MSYSNFREGVVSVECEASGAYNGADWDCDFSGEVDAVSFDGGSEWEFICPDCKREGVWILDPPDYDRF